MGAKRSLESYDIPTTGRQSSEEDPDSGYSTMTSEKPCFHTKLIDLFFKACAAPEHAAANQKIRKWDSSKIFHPNLSDVWHGARCQHGNGRTRSDPTSFLSVALDSRRKPRNSE